MYFGSRDCVNFGFSEPTKLSMIYSICTRRDVSIVEISVRKCLTVCQFIVVIHVPLL